MSYDSRPDTHEHIREVRVNLNKVIIDLINRANVHDASKLVSPEVEAFDRVTPILKTLDYGSEEYNINKDLLGSALDHHYANNSHHPEFFKNGIKGMSLMDIIEMLCDWKAAVLRMKGGSIEESIEINQKRFGYSDELKQIFINTLPLLEGSNE